MVNQTLCRPWRTQQHSRWICPEESCSLWRSHRRAPSCQELQPCQKTCSSMELQPMGDSWKRPTLEQFLKNCSPWEGPMSEQFLEDCISWEGLCTEDGKELRRKEHQRHGLTTAPIPHPPTPFCRDEEKLVVKLTLKKREREVSFYFSLSNSFINWK